MNLVKEVNIEHKFYATLLIRGKQADACQYEPYNVLTKKMSPKWPKYEILPVVLLKQLTNAFIM